MKQRVLQTHCLSIADIETTYKSQQSIFLGQQQMRNNVLLTEKDTLRWVSSYAEMIHIEIAIFVCISKKCLGFLLRVASAFKNIVIAYGLRKVLKAIFHASHNAPLPHILLASFEGYHCVLNRFKFSMVSRLQLCV